MAHHYSVEIHEFLTTRLNEAEKKLKEAAKNGSLSDQKYAEGRTDALRDLRRIMTERFDLANQKYYH